nr:unnamed protein product [Callosobruchus analis]
MDPVKEYVPLYDMWFYNNIEAAQRETEAEDAANEVSVYSVYSSKTTIWEVKKKHLVDILQQSEATKLDG